MRLEYQILLAMALDAVAGDPKWLPHPVRLIGGLAARLEALTRRLIRSELAAGVVTAAVVVVGTGAATWLLVRGAGAIHPVAADAVSVILLYTTFAARDLSRHALDVLSPLAAGDLPEARRRVALMVSRDTDALDEEGVARATVESVAENTVDGVTAPLLFALVGGPVAAMTYKAVSTLDSLFGYRNERYLRFGWASARLDDVANYLPARISAGFMVLASALMRWQPTIAWAVLISDGRKHPSPNSGLCEAAMAGALGIRLGGLNSYFGKPSEKPLIGEAGESPRRSYIGRAVALMVVTYGLTAALFLSGRMAITALAGG